MRKVLNVGGNSKDIPLPEQYQGWEHVLLDIDPAVSPDVCCDARELASLEGEQFDSVYCSHNLEHYYRHDVPGVLAGFMHVLKPHGFAYIRVPDIYALMQATLERGLDIDDVLYQSPMGPISVHDVIYGYGLEIARSGNDFFAHKTGFSPKALSACLYAAGFQTVFCGSSKLEIGALAFRTAADDYVSSLFGLPAPE